MNGESLRGSFLRMARQSHGRVPTHPTSRTDANEKFQDAELFTKCRVGPVDCDGLGFAVCSCPMKLCTCAYFNNAAKRYAPEKKTPSGGTPEHRLGGCRPR